MQRSPRRRAGLSRLLPAFCRCIQPPQVHPEPCWCQNPSQCYAVRTLSTLCLQAPHSETLGGVAAGAAQGEAGPSGSQPAPAVTPPPAQPAAAPVPITLITGYLGAGKTTLVNWVLTAKHGYRCAVLLNEIADSADIERALVKEPEVGRGGLGSGTGCAVTE